MVTFMESNNPKREFCIHSIAPEALFDLDEKGIKYKEIREENLQRELAQSGLEHYLFLRSNIPDKLYFNEIPQPGHIRIRCYIEGERCKLKGENIERLVEKYEPTTIRKGEYPKILGRIYYLAFVIKEECYPSFLIKMSLHGILQDPEIKVIKSNNPDKDS
ncbi:hypothetical protein HYX16_02125 [Candidatus Woesearchaeota archaeon]|nr:hypothetical protein [Candidatus Woesearchaeota archaeon]